jgi:hypothetical protein
MSCYAFEDYTVCSGTAAAAAAAAATSASTSCYVYSTALLWTGPSTHPPAQNYTQVINLTLDELIAKCKQLVEEEDEEFSEEFLSEKDPSILHFLLASGGSESEGGGVSESGREIVCDGKQAWTGCSDCQASASGCSDQISVYDNPCTAAAAVLLLPPGDEISSKQLRDDLMTMLIAGHETTAAGETQTQMHATTAWHSMTQHDAAGVSV